MSGIHVPAWIELAMGQGETGPGEAVKSNCPWARSVREEMAFCGQMHPWAAKDLDGMVEEVAF